MTCFVIKIALTKEINKLVDQNSYNVTTQVLINMVVFPKNLFFSGWCE